MNYKTEQEAIDAYLKENEGQTVEFEGQNCNDWLEDDQPECDGWFVGDNRCECGNRRVSLVTEGDEKSGYFAYPAAY